MREEHWAKKLVTRRAQINKLQGFEGQCRIFVYFPKYKAERRTKHHSLSAKKGPEHQKISEGRNLIE